MNGNVYYYSDYELDSKGNWIKRTKKNKEGKIQRGEVRKITYY